MRRIEFSRSVKKSYSWFSKGGNHSELNLKWKRVISILSGILTNVDWIAPITKTLKSKEFWLYLAILKGFLTSRTKIDLSSCYIILDSAPIHQSRVTRAFCKLKNHRLWYILPYSPQLAPVELMFGTRKKSISNAQYISDIHFGKSQGSTALLCSL